MKKYLMLVFTCLLTTYASSLWAITQSKSVELAIPTWLQGAWKAYLDDKTTGYATATHDSFIYLDDTGAIKISSLLKQGIDYQTSTNVFYHLTVTSPITHKNIANMWMFKVWPSSSTTHPQALIALGKINIMGASHGLVIGNWTRTLPEQLRQNNAYNEMSPH